jgi:hypothetical protein
MRAAILLVALATLGATSPVAACASCGAGDPTLTLAGTEQPFAGRVRLSVAVVSSGTVAPSDRLAERRLVVGVAWAPVTWAMLSASAPLVLRSLETTSLEHETGIGPGDLDLRARFVVLRDRVLAPTHLVTFQLGGRIPLAPALTDAQGTALDDGAQTASRTVAPIVGLSWSFYAAPFSLQTYALASVPLRGGDGLADPVELRAASLALVQVIPALSLVVGPETRLRFDSSGTSGGGGLFATVGAMVGAGDFSPYVLVRIPVVSAFDDAHTELVSLELGAALDV